jgi:hypothetical protein
MEYAIAAVMLVVVVVRKDNDTGGQAVCDRREYRSLGGFKVPDVFGISSKAYKDRR